MQEEGERVVIIITLVIMINLNASKSLVVLTVES